MSPTPHLEREVKLDAGVGFRVPERKRHSEDKPQGQRDLRLMRHGVTLRHRQDRAGGAGAERGWTLKLPAPSDGKGLVRKELTWPGGWGPVPRATASLVRAFDRGAPLVPVARLITQRRRLVLSDNTGTELLEVDDDIVSVMDGRSLAARFREVEVEVTGPGGEALLDRVVDCLVAAGALPGDDRPKVVRALGRRATESYRFSGAWSVSLRPGGRHVDHLHPMGWISSAMHIVVPAAVDRGREGWLTFGEPGLPTIPKLDAEYFVKPQAGRLVLFPSYMWHGTVPFGGEEPRLSVAFDVLPG